MMSVKNGIELCKTLKKDVRTSHIPIILLTAKDTLEDKEEGYEVGADSYLTKPFSASLFQARIQNLLDIRTLLANKISSVNWTDKQEQAIQSLYNVDNEFIGRLTKLVEEDLSSNKTDTTYLVNHTNMSASTLYPKIKYTISEISFRVGINTISYFRQCFQKGYEMSPSQ